MKHSIDFSSPVVQRLFLAFTVGMFLSCAARVSFGQPAEPPAPHEVVSAN